MGSPGGTFGSRYPGMNSPMLTLEAWANLTGALT
jgi:hypothetical protein